MVSVVDKLATKTCSPMLTLYPKIIPFGSSGAAHMTTTLVALMMLTFGAGKPTGSKNIYRSNCNTITVYSYIPASRVLTVTCSAVTVPAPFITSN